MMGDVLIRKYRNSKDEVYRSIGKNKPYVKVGDDPIDNIQDHLQFTELSGDTAIDGITTDIRGVIWFSVMDLVTLATYVMFPQVATWLPNLMG